MLDRQHGIALVCVRLLSGILSIPCLVDFTRSLVSVLILTTQFVHTPCDLPYIGISFTTPQGLGLASHWLPSLPTRSQWRSPSPAVAPACCYTSTQMWGHRN